MCYYNLKYYDNHNGNFFTQINTSVFLLNKRFKKAGYGVGTFTDSQSKAWIFNTWLVWFYIYSDKLIYSNIIKTSVTSLAGGGQEHWKRRRKERHSICPNYVIVDILVYCNSSLFSALFNLIGVSRWPPGVTDRFNTGSEFSFNRWNRKMHQICFLCCICTISVSLGSTRLLSTGPSLLLRNHCWTSK